MNIRKYFRCGRSNGRTAPAPVLLRLTLKRHSAERYPITRISKIADPGRGRCFKFRREGGSTGIFEEGEGGETDDTGRRRVVRQREGDDSENFAGRRWSFRRNLRTRRWPHFPASPEGLRFAKLASEHRLDFHYSTDVGDLGFKVDTRARSSLPPSASEAQP